MLRFRVAIVAVGIVAVVLVPGVLAQVRIETAASWETPGNVSVFDVALADVDRDGDLDLAAFAADRVRLHRNTGAAFETTASWTSGEETNGLSGEVAWADVNRDRYPDLVTSLGIYMNGNGALASTVTFDTLSSALAFAVGDVDGDGYVDLILGGFERIDLYRNRGGSFVDTSDWNTTEDNVAGSLALADVDGDGHLELAVGSGLLYRRPVRLYDNVGGDLQPSAVWEFLEEGGVNRLVFGDPDGDGYPELLVLTSNFPEAVPNRMYGNAGGVLAASAGWVSVRRTDAQNAAFVDLDGDTDLDLVVANSPMLSLETFSYVDGTELVYLNEGGVIDPAHDWESALQDVSRGLDVGDVDGDGHPDLVVANAADLLRENPGRVLVYRNLGPNRPPTITAMTASPEGPRTDEVVTITVAATDPDGDPLSHAFTATSGSVVSQTDNVLRWRAPPEAGTYTVGVNVTDAHGGWAVRELELVVVQAGEPLLSPGNPVFWLLIVAIVAAIGIGGAVTVRRRKAPPAPVPPPQFAPLGPAAPMPSIAATDSRAVALRNAYARGALTRKLYGENLARLVGAPPSPRLETLLKAFVEGRIDETFLERNLMRLKPPGA